MICDLDRIRTCDPQIRNLLLYPAELRNRMFEVISQFGCKCIGIFVILQVNFTFFHLSLMNPKDVKINQVWQSALSDQFSQPYFDNIVSQLKISKKEGKIIYPAGNDIFAIYNALNPNDVKVVILGQDPYHNLGEAMGYSFSVPKGLKIPPSLRNIYKELVSDVGTTLPIHGDLSTWVDQGIFLLNAMLTVEKNMPGAHKTLGWQFFTDATIKYLSTYHRNIVFMLWGNFAKSKNILIDINKHLVLEAAHPSPLAGNAFQGCGHFSKANSYLSEHGKSVIDWQIR
jgi:uracil-DNA glycosylase